jgi:hypothetical protein
MPRPLRTDYPLAVKGLRVHAGWAGQVLGHEREILWECPPRSDGRDDPELPAHHEPHATAKAARACARRVLDQGLRQGWWS